MKLSHVEVEVLVHTINPTVERYREMIHNDPSDWTMNRYEVLARLQGRLEEYYETTLQLLSEADDD